MTRAEAERLTDKAIRPSPWPAIIMAAILLAGMIWAVAANSSEDLAITATVKAEIIEATAADYTRNDVIAAFRREAKKAHPDAGGTPELFCQLVEAHDRLLAALGTSAPAPKAPAYAPKGAHIVYQACSRRRTGAARLDEADRPGLRGWRPRAIMGAQSA